jgi:hypothetical protein
MQVITAHVYLATKFTDLGNGMLVKKKVFCDSKMFLTNLKADVRTKKSVQISLHA